MNPAYIKQYPGTPYSVEVSAVENDPGTWNSSHVKVMHLGNVIGEYVRNYPLHARETFCPFMASDSNWYALYSAGYTECRVMRLHDDRIEDWCGISALADRGFCPAEFYVPQYRYHDSVVMTDVEYSTYQEFLNDTPDSDLTRFCTLGFLAGCFWGDDAGFSLRVLDLTEVPGKVLHVREFGNCVIPPGRSIRECLDMRFWEPGNNYVGIAHIDYYTFTTQGNRVVG